MKEKEYLTGEQLYDAFLHRTNSDVKWTKHVLVNKKTGATYEVKRTQKEQISYLMNMQNCILGILRDHTNLSNPNFIYNYFLDIVDDVGQEMKNTTIEFLRILIMLASSREKALNLLELAASEMERSEILKEHIKYLEEENKKFNIAFDIFVEKRNEQLNRDRWTTVIKFFDVINKEQDWKGKKATRETMIRKTQEALSNKQCFSMFKSKKEGRYYRIEDIVDAAMSLEYVRQEYKWSVIEEMKYKDNSRTKTELDSEGFEMSERNVSEI